MADIDALKAELAKADQAGDLDRVEQLHAEIIDSAPDTPDATESLYRLGLSLLFRHTNTQKALELFKQAAKAKEKTEFSHSARVSQALCLWAMNKRQQALFELRKMLPKDVEPSGQTAMALDFLSLFMRESGANAAETSKIDAQRKKHLETLGANAKSDEEKAHFWNRLAAAHVESGKKADLALAKSRYESVVALGKKAGPDNLKMAKTGLREIGSARR